MTMKITERYATGDRDFTRADLRGADLTGADLSGADLSGARRSPDDAPVAGYAIVTVLERGEGASR